MSAGSTETVTLTHRPVVAGRGALAVGLPLFVNFSSSWQFVRFIGPHCLEITKSRDRLVVTRELGSSSSFENKELLITEGRQGTDRASPHQSHSNRDLTQLQTVTYDNLTSRQRRALGLYGKPTTLPLLHPGGNRSAQIEASAPTNR